VEGIERLLTTDTGPAGPPPIDPLYAAFVASLPEPLGRAAKALAVTLGLSPSRDVPWSEVFSHEVTLAAPWLVAEAMPGVPPAAVADATLAHLLAVIEAFGTDRVEDGQVAETAELSALLAHARLARDRAMTRFVDGTAGAVGAYQRAERETLEAIRAERALLGSGGAVTFDRYLAVVHGKQRVGLPASLALARAAGWDDRRVRCLARLLDAVSEALQIHDDVLDWEDDLGRGGSFAASLAAPEPDLPAAKQRVHASGVLARMLAAAARRFRAARRRASALGATRLARWAREREEVTSDLARREGESPGYTNRAHALSVWARTVLA
jgi:hypothetical protein